MSTALLVEAIQALLVLLPQVPEVIALGESVVRIATSGFVSAEEEASIRAQMDAVKTAIDGASA